MNRSPCLAGLLVAALAPATTSQTWTFQAPSPTALELRGVSMISDQEAWAIGDMGVLVHTTDAGRNWTRTDLPDDMWKVTFVDSLYGWAVGNQIFRTTDGGATWIPAGVLNSTLDAVFFLDRNNGWATEDFGVWRTTNGGIDWTYHARAGGAGAGGIFFHDALRGWVVSVFGDIEKTIDGGQTWTRVYTEPGTNMYRIWFLDDLEGWVIGMTKILYTSDGGLTWSERGFPATERASSAAFVVPTSPGSDPVCYTAGRGGSIVKSTDGWLSYTVLRSMGDEVALNDIHFADENNGFAVGEYGRLLYTGDGGQTWVNRQGGGQGELHQMDANDAAHAWTAADSGRVIFTSDGGNHWEQVPVDGFSIFGSVLDVDFLDDNVTGWATGHELGFPTDHSVISHSADGGRTWQQQYASPPDFIFNTINALDAQNAVATGFHPITGDLWVRTSDGGLTWQDVTPPAPVGVVLCSDFVDSQIGYLAGGRIWKTFDGGFTWKEMANPGNVIEGISFADKKNGWAIGGFGYIGHTTNGGRTWTQQATNQFPNYHMFDVSAVSTTDAWLVALESFSPFRRLVGRTTDGGLTWIPDNVPGVTDNINTGLRTLAFVDAEYGWIGAFISTGGLAAEGGIWHRSNGAPASLALLHDRLLLGAPTQFRVTGATPGSVALFFASATGIAGTGTFNLLPPLFYVTKVPVDGTGSAVFNASVPPNLPVLEVHLQAVTVGGGPTAGTNTTSAWIEY